MPAVAQPEICPSYLAAQIEEIADLLDDQMAGGDYQVDDDYRSDGGSLSDGGHQQKETTQLWRLSLMVPNRRDSLLEDY